jgi:hypothetical protein
MPTTLGSNCAGHPLSALTTCGTLNNLSVLPPPCPATPALLLVILPSYTATVTQSSVTAIVHVLSDWHSLTHHALRLPEVGTLPCSLSQSTSDWAGLVPPLSSCVMSARILFAHFNCYMRSRSQHPKFSSFPGARLIRIGCNFLLRTLGPIVGPGVYKEKVGGCRGCG